MKSTLSTNKDVTFSSKRQWTYTQFRGEKYILKEYFYIG